jgi:hypothetical protein
MSSRAALAFAIVLSLAIMAALLYALARIGVTKLSRTFQLIIVLLMLASVFFLKNLQVATRLRHLRSYLEPIAEVFDVNSIVVLLGVTCVLFYFFFSVEHKGPVKVAAHTGILFLMVAFGAAFGYTVMARMSLLIGRLTDLIEYAEPRYGRASLWLLAVTVAMLAAWSLKQRGKAAPPADG